MAYPSKGGDAKPTGLPRSIYERHAGRAAERTTVGEAEMTQHPLEWELQQMEPGTEVLVSDANKRPVARGVLRDDRRSLSGPNGEFFSLEPWQAGWTLTILRARKSNPRGQRKM